MRRQKNIYKTAFLAEEKMRALNLWKHSTIDFVIKRYHCSQSSLYRWRQQYDGTVESLENKFSRKNMLHPNRHTDEEIKHIKDLIRRNPNIGLNELYGKLRLNYSYSRHPMSLYNFLRKRGWFGETKKRKAYIPQPYDTPMCIGEKWQLDVKVVPRECYVGPYKSEKRFFQFTVIDEATRERFIYPYEEQIATNTVDFLKRAFIFFGYKQKIIQTDNGSEFTYTRQTKNDKEHLLDKFCRENNVEHQLIRPRTPRHNGKVERSHRSDNERFYKALHFYSYEDLKMQMKAYLMRSNNIPMSVLKTRDNSQDWLTPKQKRNELLLLDWGIVEGLTASVC